MLPQWLFGVTFTYPAYFCKRTKNNNKNTATIRFRFIKPTQWEIGQPSDGFSENPLGIKIPLGLLQRGVTDKQNNIQYEDKKMAITKQV